MPSVPPPSSPGSDPGLRLGVVALVVGWLAWRRLPRLAVFVVVTVIARSSLNNAVKGLRRTPDVNRPAP